MKQIILRGGSFEGEFYVKEETIERIRKFTVNRDWQQFHTPANLAKSISIEAGELLECFQWSDTEYDLRDWSPDHIKMGKGLTLTEEELGALRDAINTLEYEDLYGEK